MILSVSITNKVGRCENEVTNLSSDSRNEEISSCHNIRLDISKCCSGNLYTLYSTVVDVVLQGCPSS